MRDRSYGGTPADQGIRAARRDSHRFTIAQQMKGLRKALKSRKTPKQLKPSMRKRLKALQAEGKRS